MDEEIKEEIEDENPTYSLVGEEITYYNKTFDFKDFTNKKKIILASCNDKIHPVIGLWKCDLLEDLEVSLNKGMRKIMLWVERHAFDTENFDHNFYDPFFNINFKEDLIQAKEIENKYIL